MTTAAPATSTPAAPAGVQSFQQGNTPNVPGMQFPKASDITGGASNPEYTLQGTKSTENREEKQPTNNNTSRDTNTGKTQMIKVKIDGVEQEVSLEDLKNAYEPKQASQKRFEEAARLRKQNEEFIRKIQTEPDAVMREVLKDKYDTWLQSRLQNNLQKEIEEARLTPEQKRERDLKAELDRYKQAEAEKKRQEEETIMNAKVAANTKAIATLIDTALVQAKLPQDTRMVRMVAQELKRFNADDDSVISGKVDINKIVKTIKQRSKEQFDWYIGENSEDNIAELLDKKTLEKIVAAYARKMETPKTPLKQTPGTKPDPMKKMKKDGRSPQQRANDEFNERIRSLQQEWEASRRV